MPLGAGGIVAFETLGAARLRDAKILQAAIAAALPETADSQPSTKR
ncbi:MAG TPA: hypothetical protein VGG45_16125 [Terracidiphilus sp.]